MDAATTPKKPVMSNALPQRVCKITNLLCADRYTGGELMNGAVRSAEASLAKSALSSDMCSTP
jgi:hypothetical protein